MQLEVQARDEEKFTESEQLTRSARCDARRRQLLETARRLFASQGFHRTGMSQIARESGIAVGQIYRDFASKEAIISALSEESLHEWLEEETLDAAIRAGDTQTITLWITRLLQEECTFEERRMLIEIMAEAGRSPVIANLNAAILGRFRPLLDRALASLAPDSSAETRTLLINLIEILSWGMTAGQELAPEMDHEALRNYITDLVRREIGLT